MNFLDAINVHIAWKLRLEAYVDGNSQEHLDPDVISKDNRCELGKWIQNEAVQYRNSALYHQIKDKHAVFHKFAAEIVRLTDAGRSKEALKLLHDEYSSISKEIKGLIIQLSREVNSE